MKHIVWVSAFVLFTLLGCQTSSVAVDYDGTVNFNKIKTYSYYSENPIQLNDIEVNNFMKALDLALQERGLMKAVDSPDIYIAVVVQKRQNKETNVVNFGIGGGDDWFGIGTNIGIPISKNVMDYEIQIDFDLASNKNLIWTGHTSKSISYNASSKEKDRFFKSTVGYLLKKYPPNSKKENYYN